MSKKSDEIMGTQPVRIDTGVLNIVRDVKEKLGFPIQRFIEEAIVEKITRLPKRQREKIGVIDKSKNNSSPSLK